MDTIGALALVISMYILLPVAVFVAAMIAMGGDRLMPAGMRNRPPAQRDESAGRHY